MDQNYSRRGILARATGWDRNPAGVWYVVGPLAVIAACLEFVQAILIWIHTGSPVLFLIDWFVFALFVVSIIPGMKLLARKANHLAGGGDGPNVPGK